VWDPAKHNTFDLNLNCTRRCTSCVQHHITIFHVLHVCIIRETGNVNWCLPFIKYVKISL